MRNIDVVISLLEAHVTFLRIGKPRPNVVQTVKEPKHPKSLYGVGSDLAHKYYGEDRLNSKRQSM